MDKTTLIIAVIAILVLVVLVIAMMARRQQGLRKQFGPEYDRTVSRTGSRWRAASELDQRRKQREQLDIQPLSQEAGSRYKDQWHALQARFVDSPAEAVHEADRLVNSVMRDRGYPMDDFDRRASDISVDYPQLVENYRSAHAIAARPEPDGTNTEDLRKAMVHYRALFEELVGTSAAGDDRQELTRTTAASDHHQELVGTPTAGDNRAEPVGTPTAGDNRPEPVGTPTAGDNRAEPVGTTTAGNDGANERTQQKAG